jgi:hypothetical protein
MQFDVHQYKREDLLRMAQTVALGSIFLPLPAHLIDGTNSKWDVENLGMFGGIYQGVKSAADGVATHGLSNLGSLFGSVNQAGMQDLANAAVAARVPGFGGSAVQALYGIAPNQFLTVLFQGPEYKQFRFEWTLSPETPQESEALRRILRAFRNTMMPNVAPMGAIWSYPNIFRIAIRPNSKYMIKFKPAVCRNFTWTPTPFGQPAFHRPDPNTPTKADNLWVRPPQCKWWPNS